MIKLYFQKLKKFSLNQIIVFSAFLLWFLPYLIFFDDGSYRIHDNLDAIVSQIKILIDNHLLFVPNNYAIDHVLNGTPRSSFPLEFNLTIFFFWLLGPLKSYILERLLVAITAYVGFRMFLMKYVSLDGKFTIIITLISLSFAFQPFWPYGGISLAGLPLLICAFMNLRNGKTGWINYLFIFYYAIYSSFVLIGFFVLIVSGVVLILDIIRKNTNAKHLFLGILYLTFLYVLINYRLFYGFVISSDYVSHRTEFLIDTTNIFQTCYSIIEIFLFGQIHSTSLQFPIIVFSVFIGIFFIPQEYKFKAYKFLVFVVGTAVIFGLYQSTLCAPLIHKITEIIPMQFDRFYMISPFCWYVLFLFGVLGILKCLPKYAYFSGIIICLLQLFFVMGNHELLKNRKSPSYKAFFAVSQFDEVKQFVSRFDNLDSIKFINLGLHPSISQYNGLKTVDGYSSDYPLRHKKEFRSVIINELNKTPQNKKYFDNWGSRCYLFCAELNGDFSIPKGNKKVIDSLDIDCQKLLNMRCKYLISVVKINTQKQPRLVLARTFRNTESAWDIYLYKVI